MNNSNPIPTNRLKISISWVIVGIPLVWGVYNSIQKSLPLFGSHTTQVVAPGVPSPVAK
jgi:hypothetical protein